MQSSLSHDLNYYGGFFSDTIIANESITNFHSSFPWVIAIKLITNFYSSFPLEIYTPLKNILNKEGKLEKGTVIHYS